MNRFAIWLLLGVFSIGLRAQTSASGNSKGIPARFIHYSILDGLPSNAVVASASDPDGFIWIATFSGLARWDGHRIVPFNQLATPTKIPEGYIKLLFCDSHGNVWVKFLREPGLYRIQTATLKVQWYQDEFFNSREAFPPSAFEDEEGNVWLATRKGLSKFEWAGNKFIFYPLVYNGENDITVQACQTPDKKIWVASGKGLFLFHPEEQRYEYVPLFEKDDFQQLIACDSEGHLWIGRWYDDAHGVIEYDPVQRRIIRTFSKKNKDPNGFISTELAHIYPDGDRVWFGCNEGGAVIWDKIRQKTIRFEPSETTTNGLIDWNVSNINKDRYANYWLSTSRSLDFLPNTDKTAEILKNNPYQSQSLTCSKSYTAIALSNGNMVFGTDRGFSIYNPFQNTWVNGSLPNLGNEHYNNIIIGMAEHDAHSFWVGSWGDALCLIDNRTGAILKAISGEGYNTPHRMLQDNQGELWLTYNDGKPVRLKDGHFLVSDTLINDDNHRNDFTNCFADLNAQYLLLGSSDGLLRYDRYGNRYEAIPLVFPGLQKPYKIISLCVSKQHWLYLIVNDRIFGLDLEKMPSEATPVSFPFPIKNCLDLIEDNQGDMWVCAEGGLARFNLQKGTRLFFDARNFLQGNTFYAIWKLGPAAKGADGRLYFAGVSGVSVVNPQALSASAAPPIARISGLRINNQLLVLDSAIHRMSHLRLPSWQNNLSFEFSALGSTLPELNRYAYRLSREGFWNKKETESWVELGEQSVVNFSNLSPGDYYLQVRAVNSDGTWCDTPANLHITIQWPWYRSWLAFVGYLLLLAGGGWIWYRYQLNLRLKHAETIRLKDLDSFKTRFFTNITHEFRTPLTVILGMTEQLKKHFTARAEAAHEKSVEMIQRNGQNLLHLINQILDLAKLESGKLNLQLERSDIVAFTRYISESFHSYAEARKIQLHFLAETEVLDMDYDREKVQAMVSNLLSNAIKFTPEGGHVYVHIEQIMKNGRPYCQLMVRDTGIGIPEDKLGQIFDRFYQIDHASARVGEGTGIGLALTKELAGLMGGEISVSSKAGAGAIFSISLPVTVKSETAQGQHPVKWKSGIAPKPSPAKRLDEDSSKPLLLIVEDNEDVRQYLIDCVSDQYQVLEAQNGRIGIEKAIESIPDLIVSDVMMPEKDGLELCQTLKNDERTSHIPIVLLTAKADVKSRIEGFSRGADEYVAKPFEREELLARLRNLIENRRRLQSRYATLPLPAVSEDPELKLEDAFLLKIRNVVEASLSDADFEMPQLERALGMSRSQIFRKVKALTDQSPSLFIRSIRLHKAKDLLRNTQLTVSEIAYEVGFTTPSYFSTAFLEAFGKNPSDFRQS